MVVHGWIQYYKSKGDPLVLGESNFSSSAMILDSFSGLSKRFLTRCRKKIHQKLTVTKLKEMFCKNNKLDIGLVIIARLVLFKMVEDNLDTMKPFNNQDPSNGIEPNSSGCNPTLRDLLATLGDNYEKSI